MSISSGLFGTQVMVPFNVTPIPTVNGTLNTVNNGAPGIDSGPIAGEVLSEKGNAFLDPNQILSTINTFGSSIGSGGLLSGNPNNIDIARITENGINSIFTRNFIPDTVQVPLLNLPLALPIPDVTQDPSAGQLNLASLFMTNLIKSLNNPASAPATTISTAQDISPFTGILSGLGNNNNAAFDEATGVGNSSLAPGSQNLLQLGNLLPGIFPAVATGANAQNQLNTIPGLNSATNGSINPGTNGLLGFGAFIPNTVGQPVATGANAQNQLNTVPGLNSATNGSINPGTNGLLGFGAFIPNTVGQPVATGANAQNQLNTVPGLNSATNGPVNAGTNGLLGFGAFIPNTVAQPVATGANAQTQLNTIPGLTSAASGSINAGTSGLLGFGSFIPNVIGQPVVVNGGRVV